MARARAALALAAVALAQLARPAGGQGYCGDCAAGTASIAGSADVRPRRSAPPWIGAPICAGFDALHALLGLRPERPELAYPAAAGTAARPDRRVVRVRQPGGGALAVRHGRRAERIQPAAAGRRRARRLRHLR